MHERPLAGIREVPPYLVVCLDSDPQLEANGHRHVASIQTRDPDGGETRWTAVQVIAAIRDGERFVVAEGAGGGDIVLEPSLCPRCPTITLVTDPPEASPTRCR